MSDAAEPVKTSHPIGFWFFFWGEFAERCSYYGMRAILALYMTERLGFDKADAASFMSIFIAACYFFPLIGGWIADNYLGKYVTIVAFSLPYVLAQFLVGIENKYVVYFALTLLAMGSGVIKPNISTLMGLTYDQQRPGQTKLRTSAFSWFYMSINIGAALSQLGMPYLRNKYGFQVAFLFPAGLMAIALVIFALGKPFYAVEKIERKKLTPEEAAEDWRLKKETLLQIGALFALVMFFWGIFDQSASTWIFYADTFMESIMLGELPNGSALLLSGETLNKLIGRTTFGMSADAIQAFNPIFIIVLVPISVFLFKIFPLKATTKMLLGFLLTGVTMVIMSVAGFLAGAKQDAVRVTFNQQVMIYVPLAQTGKEMDKLVSSGGSLTTKFGDVEVFGEAAEYNKDNKKITLMNGRLVAGPNDEMIFKDGRIDFVNSKLTLVNNKLTFPGVLEIRWNEGRFPAGEDSLVIRTFGRVERISGERMEIHSQDKPKPVELAVVEWVKPDERVSIWWQVFAYLILTIAEILISITGLELAFVAAPPTMKSFVTACWLVVVFLANFVVNLPVTRLWGVLPPSYYFAMLAGMMLIVVIVFIPVAKQFDEAMAAKEAAEKAANPAAEKATDQAGEAGG